MQALPIFPFAWYITDNFKPILESPVYHENIVFCGNTKIRKWGFQRVTDSPEYTRKARRLNTTSQVRGSKCQKESYTLKGRFWKKSGRGILERYKQPQMT